MLSTFFSITGSWAYDPFNSIGLPPYEIRSPLSSNLSFRYPRYFPIVKSWTTGIFFDGFEVGLIISGYLPYGFSFEGGVPVKQNQTVISRGLASYKGSFLEGGWNWYTIPNYFKRCPPTSIYSKPERQKLHSLNAHRS